MADEILSVDFSRVEDLFQAHELLRSENADLRQQLEEALREIRGLLECRCLTCADKARALLVELEAK